MASRMCARAPVTNVTMIDVSDAALAKGRRSKGRATRSERFDRCRRATPWRAPLAFDARRGEGATFAINRDRKFRSPASKDLRRAEARPARRRDHDSRIEHEFDLVLKSPRPDDNRSQVIGMHESVPVGPARRSSRARHERRDIAANALATALGKTPVEAQDYPGFIANHHSDADDQRGGLRDGGRRRKRSTRS